MPTNREDSSYPKALAPPSQAVVPITLGVIERAVLASRESPRRRIIQPLHKRSDALLQRMLNALQPGSYIQPHRHGMNPARAESIVVLSGSICYVTFTDSGDVDAHCIVAAQSQQIGVDTEGGVYHTFFALEPDTVLFEVKPGPYDPAADKGFAEWAPAEGSDGTATYLAELAERVGVL